MRELPTGTVTFLFSDIEGSTSLLRELGNDYATALGEHRDVVRAAVADAERAPEERLDHGWSRNRRRIATTARRFTCTRGLGSGRSRRTP